MGKRSWKIMLSFVLLFFLVACKQESSEESGERIDSMSEIQPESKSNVVVTTLYSKVLGIDWNYDVYLPNDYNENNKNTYPVIYMLHGLYGNHRNLLERFDSQKMLDDLISEVDQEAVVVFVDGFNSFYINQNEGMQMESAFVEELIPYIASEYNISDDRGDHAIGGISMGGYGAARFVLKNSDYFSKAICLSPAVWQDLSNESAIRQTIHAFNDGNINWSKSIYDGNFPTNFINEDMQEVSFFVASTEDDSVVPISDVEVFVDTLSENGIPVDYERDKGDDHNWIYWEKAAKNGYKWALENFK